MSGHAQNAAGGSITPGELIVGAEQLVINSGLEVETIAVVNTGDRPVQVGSHFHFAESNPALKFDRALVWGMRLDIPAGTAARFEPGIEREVSLVPLGGNRIVPGLRGDARGSLDGKSPMHLADPGSSGNASGGS